MYTTSVVSLGSLVRFSGQSMYTTPVVSLGSIVKLAMSNNLHYICSISGQPSEVSQVRQSTLHL